MIEDGDDEEPELALDRERTDLLEAAQIPGEEPGPRLDHRRLLVDLAERRPLGDTTSLQDSTVPERIAELLAPSSAE